MVTYKYNFNLFIDRRTRFLDYMSLTSLNNTLQSLKKFLKKKSIFSDNYSIKIDNIREINISVSAISLLKIQNLNKIYRKKQQPTDVLSFNYDVITGKILFLGELYLCPSFIRMMAHKFKTTFEFEFWQDLVHGVLHLHGFEHGDDMFDLQNRILKEILV